MNKHKIKKETDLLIEDLRMKQLETIECIKFTRGKRLKEDLGFAQ